MPDSTSPVPAVASHEVPVVFALTGRPRSAISVVDPLSRTGHLELLDRPADVFEPPGLDVLGVDAEESAQLTGVRGDQGGGLAVQQFRVLGHDGERVGVDDHRQIGAQHLGDDARGPLVGPHARPEDPGLHPADLLDRIVRRGRS